MGAGHRPRVLSQLRPVSPDLGTMVGVITPDHMGASPFSTHRSVFKAMELGRACVQTAQLLTSPMLAQPLQLEGDP